MFKISPFVRNDKWSCRVDYKRVGISETGEVEKLFFPQAGPEILTVKAGNITD